MMCDFRCTKGMCLAHKVLDFDANSFLYDWSDWISMNFKGKYKVDCNINWNALFAMGCWLIGNGGAKPSLMPLLFGLLILNGSL